MADLLTELLNQNIYCCDERQERKLPYKIFDLNASSRRINIDQSENQNTHVFMSLSPSGCTHETVMRIASGGD